ncbi:hypothetical protein R5R35_012343 [Gryllus longicercus]|uniref:Pre-mRNA-processing factor 39 n=1 Tax=Gryllus longicercus TaxID=2509291 RepID=A0AAN9V6W7_9ORTH
MASNEGDISDSVTRRPRTARPAGKRGRGRKKVTPSTRSTRSKRNLYAAEVVEADDVTEDVQEEHDTEEDPTSPDVSKEEDDLVEATSEDGDKLFHSLSESNATENGVEDDKLQTVGKEEFVEEEEGVSLSLEEQQKICEEEDDIYEEDGKLYRIKHEVVEYTGQEEFGESSGDSNQVKQEYNEDDKQTQQEFDEESSHGVEREVPELEDTAIPSPVHSDVQVKMGGESGEESQSYSQEVVEEIDYQYSVQEEIAETNDVQSNRMFQAGSDADEKELPEQELPEQEEKSFVQDEMEVSNVESEGVSNEREEKMETGEENEDNGETDLPTGSDLKSEKKQLQEDNNDSNFQTEPDTEMVSEDELPTETKEPLETEAVSDEELPEPATAVDLPETEAVSEDELPPEKTDKKKKKTLTSKSSEGENSIESSGGKKKRSEAPKRKLSEGDTYDPSSPTSENSCDESPAAKRAAVAGGGSTPQAKPMPKSRKSLPELDKYWEAVTEDPSDFTGWTYLLQYVDQENDIEAAREAYDAFLSHYPYCYGYWRKYADYEKRKGNKEKCEDVFERGLKSIPLSVDLWIHYLNYCKATYPEDEEHLRTQFEKAINACGMEFRSDKLWESYIKWETEGKRFQNVTALYDRLLTVPTQGYTKHFDNFQEHISNNPPQKVLSVDEFLTLRREVLQLLKQYDQPLTTDDVAPGEKVEAPPGEESEEQPAVKSDEETTALRERIISLRRKIHKNTVAAVADRWHYEEGIKRPYFHVKPLERCQLKNWIEYLDYEIEQGDKDRIIILFERCLIACALYEEFWIKFICYLESLNEDMTDKIRNVYERACTIHHTKKPNLHLHWAVFEESHQNYDKASEILNNLEKLVPNMLQVAYRRINLERRRNNLEKVCALYEHYISSSKNKVIANNMAIKYARFCWKIKGDVEKAILVLNKAVEKDRENPRLYLQLIDMGLQRSPLNESEILCIIDQFLNRDADPEQKVLFAQRKVEFMEDFGSDVLCVQKAHDEFQKYLKMAKDRKKKSPDIDGKIGDGSPSKKKNQAGAGDGTHSGHGGSHSSSQSPHSGSGSQPPQPPSGAQLSTTAAGASQYPPPSYAQASGYSQPPPAQGGYQGGQYPPTGAQQPPTPYSQPPYNQQYSQSGDPSYANYQNWGYSQTGYGGYNQGWNYNYYQ